MINLATPMVAVEPQRVRTPAPVAEITPQIVLSFDVEEHYRIEAAANLNIPTSLKKHYAERVVPMTNWLMDQLAMHDIKATFFVVGRLAQKHKELVRAMHEAGHEVACHGWDHARIHTFTIDEFREDVTRTKETLEQITGAQVVGYRAPTFSVVKQTAWAIDVLAEVGMLYDSSIYPIWHDRYGVPHAPVAPFLAGGPERAIIELPLATLRCLGMRLPVGGGGYFRLLPLFLLERAITQARKECTPPVAVLYFHPWEFDKGQARLPLGRLSRFRTYVGIGKSADRFSTLIERHHFSRAVDVASVLDLNRNQLATVAIS